jgi:hypothetical protein
LGGGTFLNFTNKQAAAYYKAINFAVLVKIEPEIVSIDKYEFSSTLMEHLETDVRICGESVFTTDCKEVCVEGSE